MIYAEDQVCSIGVYAHIDGPLPYSLGIPTMLFNELCQPQESTRYGSASSRLFW